MGLTLSYGRHVDERDPFDSSSVASRVADLHEAFSKVKGILTVIGGLQQQRVAPVPGLGPDRGQSKDPVWIFRHHCCLLFDQDNDSPLPGEGWWSLQEGTATGRIIGGNLTTLNLLQGTAQMPALADAVLMLEADASTDAMTFARDLTSLLQQPGTEGIQGLVLGRFPSSNGVTIEHLQKITARPPLAGLPVLANVDFGHTQPQLTLPIGGQAGLTVNAAGGRLKLSDH